MDEAELRGVQGEARHPDRIRLRLAVDLVAEHGVAEEREVDARLVGTAGVQFGLDQRRLAERLERAHHRGCLAAAARQRGAARARGRTADTAVDAGFARERAGDEREVAACHRVEAQLLLQVAGRRVVPGQHHHARGVAVEAVDDVQAVVSRLALRQLGKSTGDHGVALVLDRRVDDQTGRLVDDDHVGVEVEDRQRGQPRPARPPRPGRVVTDRRPDRHPRARIDDHEAVNQDVAGLHLALGARERHAEQLLDRPREAMTPGRVGGSHRLSVAPRWTTAGRRASVAA